jgi:hypothetical protein
MAVAPPEFEENSFHLFGILAGGLYRSALLYCDCRELDVEFNLQVVTIVTILVLAAHIESRTSSGMNEWQACVRPLGIWCCLWVVRVFLACGLSYWAWVRERKS